MPQVSVRGVRLFAWERTHSTSKCPELSALFLAPFLTVDCGKGALLSKSPERIL